MLDATNYRILRALQHDGRMTNQALSEQVGLSPSPCLKRLRQLEDEGVIQGYAAVIDPVRYGLPVNAFVTVRLTRQNELEIRTFESAVASWDEVMDCFLMTGTRDYMLRVVVADLGSYERFLKTRLTSLDCIAAVESNLAMGVIKHSRVLPVVSA
jgi:DNA-binding Lrp family transcriptional regulator